MRDERGSFSGMAPADMEELIGEVQGDHPAMAYMGPIENGFGEWTDEELDSMGAAIFAGLVSMRL
jgi:hypothetical protein